eukprot:TRINITY_DN1843_c0_g1_i1.p1 TRINITY_DN1843_c0_g1~~TRINITY_DN1843_c0_g1_i1.p1  ORF type:complete len:529 (+),score=216.08 TRINITY_DN1843_c0_g1_i1:110-1696(+)
MAEGQQKKVLQLDGETLTLAEMMIIHDDLCTLEVTEEAWTRIREGRAVVDRIIESGEVVYGINTGFGNFASVVIAPDKLKTLQENLIRSHAAGIGRPLPPERVRMLLALRINVLCKGFSGISEKTLHQLLEAYNKGCLSYVPEKGTVGASGDLAPLAHLALGLLGEGKMWDPVTEKFDKAMTVLEKNGLRPLHLKAKEGLALINGTQFITAFASEACFRARTLARSADIIGALTLEALKGSPKAFSACIHAARPHVGQQLVATRLRTLLHSEDPQGFRSEIYESHKYCSRVQDSYTLRCMPQVHGVTWDTITFCKSMIETEINSATDNPMVFADTNSIMSGGNFHGEYPAKACDYLAIAVHELANISERRIERLINQGLSGLPAFLVKDGGLHSGFMIAHCTAAALTSENKTLVHPGSSDTISTSAGKEDHVSMGGWAARKCLEVVTNVETVLAIELLAACQAIDFLRPLRSTEPLEKLHELVRSKVATWDQDRFMNPDIEAATELIRSGAVWEAVKPFLNNAGIDLD